MQKTARGQLVLMGFSAGVKRKPFSQRATQKRHFDHGNA